MDRNQGGQVLRCWAGYELEWSLVTVVRLLPPGSYDENN